MPKGRNIEEYLIEKLQDPEEALEYLRAAFKEGDREVILLAIRDVINAREGMEKFASKSKVNRQNLYKMLSKDGNPRLESFFSVISALGLKLSPEWNVPQKKRA